MQVMLVLLVSEEILIFPCSSAPWILCSAAIFRLLLRLLPLQPAVPLWVGIKEMRYGHSLLVVHHPDWLPGFSCGLMFSAGHMAGNIFLLSKGLHSFSLCASSLRKSASESASLRLSLMQVAGSFKTNGFAARVRYSSCVLEFQAFVCSPSLLVTSISSLLLPF